MVPKAKITRVDEILTYYRWHNKNETTKNNNRMRTELFLTLDKYIDNLKDTSDRKIFMKYLKNINSDIKENNLYEGYLALQLIKVAYKLKDNYDLLKIKNAQNILFSAINNYTENNPANILNLQ